MKTKQKVRKKRIGAEAEQPEVPEDFICIDPAQKHLVFDFLNGFNHAAEEVAVIHLRLCLHCREIAAIVLKNNESLEAQSGHCLHAEEMELAFEADGV